MERGTEGGSSGGRSQRVSRGEPAPTCRTGGLPEGDLVRAYLRGDPAAWETLVRTHAGLIYAVIRHCGFDGDEAADLFHIVWLTVREHLSTVRDERALPRWLAATAAREARWARRQRATLALLPG